MADDDKKDGRIDLVCRDCDKAFYLSKKEADFYKSQHFAAPRSCWSCRQWRKLSKEKGDS